MHCAGFRNNSILGGVPSVLGYDLPLPSLFVLSFALFKILVIKSSSRPLREANRLFQSLLANHFAHLVEKGSPLSHVTQETCQARVSALPRLVVS